MKRLLTLIKYVLNSLRPPPLGNGFFSFLHPPVPLVPAVPKDVSDHGDSAASDARLFPSDDELSQRTIWTALMLVLTFTVVGLAGAIPLYVVSTPCTGNTAPDSTYGGRWSALHDLSLLRLLQLLREGNINSQPGLSSSIEEGLERRLTVDGKDYAHTARIRLLILTVLLLVVAVLPTLFRLLREFNRLLAYHKRWVAVKCDGLEMGWLSISRAPGLKGLGEADVKQIFERTGMTKRLGGGSGAGHPSGSGSDSPPPRRTHAETPSDEEDGALTGRRRRTAEGGDDIDVTGVFSIVCVSVSCGGRMHIVETDLLVFLYLGIHASFRNSSALGTPF